MDVTITSRISLILILSSVLLLVIGAVPVPLCIFLDPVGKRDDRHLIRLGSHIVS